MTDGPTIREIQFSKPKQNDGVVQLLEEWLAKAKDGTVQVCGLVGVKPDGTVSTEWRGLSGGGKHELISGTAILQYRLLTANVGPD